MRILATIVCGLFFMLMATLPVFVSAQDSATLQYSRRDSGLISPAAAPEPNIALPDSLPLPEYLEGSDGRGNAISKVLRRNEFLNSSGDPVFMLSGHKRFSGKEWLFYIVCTLLLILGIFKVVFRSYFNNLFLIFFNTSLRQSQLTDQLAQAKLPSFILNIFFVLSGGTYIWLLFTRFNKLRTVDEWMLLPLCFLALTLIYVVKYLLLKFTGWLAGMQPVTNVYIFIIFLVNKIAGILLIPFLVLLAFANNQWSPAVATVSALLIGLLFISRYFKSFGALENKLRINTFHLIIFILAVEVLPLLIIYKAVADYLL